ncbi:hypothetical protein STTU_5922 [Streptomyces sp. Tu6071]|nr:hypothetical protein STTU_5922 [Streptomyces sp. Tu6071]
MPHRRGESSRPGHPPGSPGTARTHARTATPVTRPRAPRWAGHDVPSPAPGPAQRAAPSAGGADPRLRAARPAARERETPYRRAAARARGCPAAPARGCLGTRRRGPLAP